MIKSFRDGATQELWESGKSRKIPAEIHRAALRKLAMLNRATSLTDLRVPPNNRLEALQRDRKGQHSIRINDQYRVCFVWRSGEAEDVEIVDYH